MWGSVERRIGIGCEGGPGGQKKAPEGSPGLRSDDETAASCQPRGKTIGSAALVQWQALVANSKFQLLFANARVAGPKYPLPVVRPTGAKNEQTVGFCGDYGDVSLKLTRFV